MKKILSCFIAGLTLLLLAALAYQYYTNPTSALAPPLASPPGPASHQHPPAPRATSALPPPTPSAPMRGASPALAMPPPRPPQRLVFGGGTSFQASDLPAGPLRNELEALSPSIYAFAIERLTQMTFHINDLTSLHVDQAGMPFYVCNFSNLTEGIPISEIISDSTPGLTIPGIVFDVPVTAPPALHSKPGNARILFLNFSGGVVTNTAWNSSIARWDCRPFDRDGNTNTFSTSEQSDIIRMWERISEDFAPFDVDVTTERPTTWTSTTGHAMITPSTDYNGKRLPHYSYGGIAYVGVFGNSSYPYYSPAFVLPMNPPDIAEATSHELGHNLGLSHDGTASQAYYGGHGSGEISWGPIMGTGYGRNISQWCKGEYYNANLTQDDLAMITAKLPYRTDDHGNTLPTATFLAASNGTILISSGLISSNTDIDVFSFSAGVGLISIAATPYRCASDTYGNNLDICARLYHTNGTLLATDNPTNTAKTLINYTASVAGKYYLHISSSGTGTPTNNPPSGYTPYGSIGQYFITGQVVLVGYTYTTNNGLITITSYTGSDAVINVPSTINGLPVRLIASNAFLNRTTLTSVTIPASITNIGANAFAGCTNLTSLYFLGNPPTLGTSALSGANQSTVYYYQGSTGWSSTFGGRPTVMVSTTTAIPTLGEWGVIIMIILIIASVALRRTPTPA